MQEMAIWKIKKKQKRNLQTKKWTQTITKKPSEPKVWRSKGRQRQNNQIQRKSTDLWIEKVDLQTENEGGVFNLPMIQNSK